MAIDAILTRANTIASELELLPRKFFSLNFTLTKQNERTQAEQPEESAFIWDWPFSSDRNAQGAYTKEKFIVCLPFNKGGTGETNGTTRKLERIAESGFSWSLGLSRDAELSTTCFWRLEIEVQRNNNTILLIASRDISAYDMKAKRLKRVRKVYRLPNYYDVATTTTIMYDWAVVVQVMKREDNKPLLRRTMTMT